MPLSAGKPILQAALAKAFVDAMNEYKKFDQTGNSGVDSSVAATNAAGAVFGASAAPAVDAFVKTGLVSTEVATTGSAAAQAGKGTGAVT
jgi:hypothetical protein